MSSVSITTNKLTIGYPSDRFSGHQAIIQRELSLQFQRGEMIAMLGRNGCGKSTLLRTLAGLQPALSGTYRIHSAESLDSTSVDSPASHSAQPALVLTEHDAIGMTTVHDIVAMGRYEYTDFLGGLSEKDEQIIFDSLVTVGLITTDAHRESLYNRTFDSLSDGERARVLIAKALAQETEVILLDEPTAHLDLPNRILTLRLLHHLAHSQNKTILISTHELELALAESDRILLMMPDCGGVLLDTADHLKQAGAFEKAFGMQIFL